MAENNNSSPENAGKLHIGEKKIDTLLRRNEEGNSKGGYSLVADNDKVTDYIGKTVSVKIDRPKGSKHPKHGFEYPVNYGYVPFTKSGDGEELDAYVLMLDEPVNEYTGRCIGVIHRTNDDDDKLIVVPEGCNLPDEEIEKQTDFQEKWFKHILLR